jgi:L-histidine N-alpha-methyltransferase
MSMQVFAASNAEAALNLFAEDVRRGLTGRDHKSVPSTYLYDSVGSALFDAITLLPEYGLTRADESLLRAHAPQIAKRCGPDVFVAELGSGSGAKTRSVLKALGPGPVPYYPIDVSPSALDRCVGELQRFADVRPIQASYLEGLEQVLAERERGQSMLLLFLGSTIGNFDRASATAFLKQVRNAMFPGDHLLIGADLVKPVPVMLAAYDDPLGITAAFNRNLLARMNRELNANFDLYGFHHEVRWCDREQRIEMHLRAQYAHVVQVPAAGIDVRFRSGETIWTESSHKFTLERLRATAAEAGFRQEICWTNQEWPFAECLWSV